MSVDQGQMVEFKIDTDTADYRIDIYRMGWYGGLGARKWATIDPLFNVPQEQPEAEVDEELEAKLNTPIQELELSVRASNCLELAKIETVRQLVQMSEAELLKIRSFGKTSLREIKRKLADVGLSLGMKEGA